MTQSQSDSEQLTPENAVQRTRNLDAVAPGITVVKTLFELSGNQCYYPGCEELMTREGRQQVNGDIAHICGEKPGAARYDEALGARVDDFENLMLLCPSHHRLVDHLEPDNYPVEQLRQMKAQHEEHGDKARQTAPGGVGKHVRMCTKPPRG